MRGSRHFFQWGGGGGISVGGEAYFSYFTNLKYPGRVSPTPNPSLDPRMKISTIMNVR